MAIQEISQAEADTYLKCLYNYWDGIVRRVPRTFDRKTRRITEEKSLFEIVFGDEYKNIPKADIVANGDRHMWSLSDDKRYYYLGTAGKSKYLYGIAPFAAGAIGIASVGKLPNKKNDNIVHSKTMKDESAVRCLRELISDYLVPLAIDPIISADNKIDSIQAYAATDEGKILFKYLLEYLVSNPIVGVKQPTFNRGVFSLKLSE